MKITIYGPGCANCKELERRARQAITELEQEADFEKVEDFQGILDAGVVRTPALAIDGQMRLMGQVPPVDRLKNLLARTPDLAAQ